MMDRTATLLRQAKELKRRIWASMRLGFRILALFDSLASVATDTFGRLLYAEFLRHNVQDMPPIRGMTAEEYKAKIGERGLKDRDLSSKLPPGYGQDFATRIRNKVRGMPGINGNEAHTEEVLSRFMLRSFLSELRTMRDGLTLRAAEGYVFEAVENEVKNYVEHLGTGALGRSKSIHVRTPGGEEKTIDVRDTRFLDKLERKYPLHEMLRDPFIRRALEAIHPDAVLYIELALEGYDDEQIIGDPRTGVESKLPSLRNTPMTPQNWNKTYKPKIYNKLIEFEQYEKDADA